MQRRRELYPQIMDEHGVASCPARLNWSLPTSVMSPAPEWKPASPESDGGVFIPVDRARHPGMTSPS